MKKSNFNIGSIIIVIILLQLGVRGFKEINKIIKYNTDPSHPPITVNNNVKNQQTQSKINILNDGIKMVKVLRRNSSPRRSRNSSRSPRRNSSRSPRRNSSRRPRRNSSRSPRRNSSRSPRRNSSRSHKRRRSIEN